MLIIMATFNVHDKDDDDDNDDYHNEGENFKRSKCTQTHTAF